MKRGTWTTGAEDGLMRMTIDGLTYRVSRLAFLPFINTLPGVMQIELRIILPDTEYPALIAWCAAHHTNHPDPSLDLDIAEGL